jgi:hypothetical protein
MSIDDPGNQTRASSSPQLPPILPTRGMLISGNADEILASPSTACDLMQLCLRRFVVRAALPGEIERSQTLSPNRKWLVFGQLGRNAAAKHIGRCQPVRTRRSLQR